MSEPTRRDFCSILSLLPALALLPSPLSSQETGADLTRSKVFSLKKLPVVHQAAGWETRQIFRGTLPTGEYVDIHQSTLPAGQMPHPPHRHRHGELMVLLQGEIDFYNDSETERMETGDIVYAASNQLHGWKNVGDKPAQYYVIAIGLDKK